MTKTLKISHSDKRPKTEKSDIQVERSEDGYSVTGIPDGDVLEYLATLKDDLFFVVHGPGSNRNYDLFRLHIGPERNLIEAEVKYVARLRDGGTINISYLLDNAEGLLHFPIQFDKQAKPTNTIESKVSELILLYP